MPSNRLFALTFIVSISILSNSVRTESPAVVPFPSIPPVLPSEDNEGSYKVDLNIMNLNGSFKRMGTGDNTQINLADDSYYTLAKPDENTLLVTVVLYSPGDGTHQPVYNGKYVWNDQADSLIAETCKENEVQIEKPVVNADCSKGIIMASEIISLEIEGSVDMNKYEKETLEDCLSAKLPPKVVNKSYMTCLIKVLGDKKYAQEAVDAKIKDLESSGYQCSPDGSCYKNEDPDVFAAQMESLNGKPTPVEVFGDSRPRYCGLKSHPLMADMSSDTTKYIVSHNKKCKKWVNSIYCHVNNGVVHFAIEYINEKNQKSMFMPHSFNLYNVGVKNLKVNWRNGVRINTMKFRPDKKTLAIKRIKMYMSNGDELKCGVNGNLKESTHNVKVGLMGEIAGFEYAKIADGIRLKNLIERS